METLCMSPTPDYTDEELRERYSPANLNKLTRKERDDEKRNTGHDSQHSALVW